MNEYELDKNEHREWLDHIKDAFPEILILPSEDEPDDDLYFLPATSSVVAAHPYGELVSIISEAERDPDRVVEALKQVGWLQANPLVGPTWDVVHHE